MVSSFVKIGVAADPIKRLKQHQHSHKSLQMIYVFDRNLEWYFKEHLAHLRINTGTEHWWITEELIICLNQFEDIKDEFIDQKCEPFEVKDEIAMRQLRNNLMNDEPFNFDEEVIDIHQHIFDKIQDEYLVNSVERERQTEREKRKQAQETRKLKRQNKIDLICRIHYESDFTKSNRLVAKEAGVSCEFASEVYKRDIVPELKKHTRRLQWLVDNLPLTDPFTNIFREFDYISIKLFIEATGWSWPKTQKQIKKRVENGTLKKVRRGVYTHTYGD